MIYSTKMSLVLVFFFASSFFFQGTLAGDVICESLPTDLCSFAVASSGKRCVLENYMNGQVGYTCKTSEVVVEGLPGHIETDDCVYSCGVDRRSVGISSDALMDNGFTAWLCSPDCQQKCPNIVDLYSNLAAGEGVHLPDLCEKQMANPHRSMLEFLSSGVAPGPVPVTDSLVEVPAIAPAAF